MSDLPFATDPAGRAAAEDAYAKAWGASAAGGAVPDGISSSDGWTRADAIVHIRGLSDQVAANTADFLTGKALEEDTLAALRALGVADAELAID